MENDLGERKLPEMQAVAARLAQERFTFTERELGIRVIVNGRGRVLDLMVPQNQVYGANAAKLANAITQAILAAKRQANNVARQRLYDVIGDDLQVGSLIKPPEPSGPAPLARPQTPAHPQQPAPPAVQARPQMPPPNRPVPPVPGVPRAPADQARPDDEPVRRPSNSSSWLMDESIDDGDFSDEDFLR